MADTIKDGLYIGTPISGGGTITGVVRDGLFTVVHDPAYSSGYDLVVAEADHVHVIDNLTLTIGHTFETDFSEYTTGIALSDWTERWTTTNFSNTVQAGGTFTYQIGKELSLSNTSNARKLLSWDDIDGYADIDILVLFSSSAFSNQGFRIYARCSGSTSSETGYFINGSASNIVINKYVGGTSTAISSVACSLYDTGYYYWARFKVSGTSLKLKLWRYTTPEPIDWIIETTDSDISSGGWNGIGGFNASTSYCYWFGAYIGIDPSIPDSYTGIQDLTTLPISVTTNTLLNSCSIQGGMPPTEKQYNLVGASIYCYTLHLSQVRLAVYTGGSLTTGPDGATLLADLGETTGSDTSTNITLSCSPISLPKGQPFWVAFKGNDSNFRVVYSGNAGDCGSFDFTNGRYVSSVVSTDETVAFPSTWPSDSGSFSGFHYLVAALIQEAVFSIDDAYHEQYADNITLDTGAENLVVAETYHDQTANNLTLSETVVLAVDSVDHLHYADEPNVNSNDKAFADDCYHLNVVDNVDLTLTYNLIVAECYHIHGPPNLTLTQTHNLTVDPADHLTSSDNIDLVSKTTISPADSYHDQFADAVTVFSVDGAYHDQAADTIDLVQVFVLTVAESYHDVHSRQIIIVKSDALKLASIYHTHAVDSLYLIHPLTVDACDHLHTVDSLYLIHPLTVAPADHIHTADNITLGVVLVPIPDYMEHYVDSVTLTQDHALHDLDAYHILTNDAFHLIQQQWAWPDDASHTNTVDSVTLTQDHYLTLADADHLQTVDAITLLVLYFATVQESYHAHYADNIWIPALPSDLGATFLASATIFRTIIPLEPQRVTQSTTLRDII